LPHGRRVGAGSGRGDRHGARRAAPIHPPREVRSQGRRGSRLQVERVSGRSGSLRVAVAHESGGTRPRATGLQFRQLTLEELPLLDRWLNAGPVLRWYAKRPLTQQEVNDKYAPRASGDSPVKVHVALVDGKASGMFQFYPLAAFPEYAAALGARPG